MKAQGGRVGLAWALVLLLGVGVPEARAAPSDSGDLQEGVSLLQKETGLTGSERDDKVFLVFLKIQPDQCTTNDGAMTAGTCLPSKECTSSGGTESGSCAKGFGVCCIAQRRCGGSTTFNNTYFVNPGYPSSDTGTAGACTLTVNRLDSNICQIRIDMIDFELSQPDDNGNCIVDFLSLPSSTAPQICGSNDGQHMYVEVDPAGGPVKVTVDRSAASTINRRWNIKVTQIPCDSQYRAPSGCLQYYTATSGTVSSFNFLNAAPTGTGTRQMANVNYGVCIKMSDNSCILWTRNTTGGDYGFTVSGNTNTILPDLIGDAVAGSTGTTDCTMDYVIIPGGVDNLGNPADRFCGLGFPESVSSNKKPFVLYVNQDSDEATDVGNQGFSLDYRQVSSC